MKIIEFDKIFRIASDGVYFDGGKIDFNTFEEKDGFHGEEKFEDGQFVICFFDSEQTSIIFPFSLFGYGENAVKNARAKCGSCALFLKGVGVNVKTLEN